MRHIFGIAVLLAVSAAPALAADKTVTTIPPPAQHVVLVQGGSFALNGPTYSVPLTGVTGLFGWGPARLDAAVEPNLTGGYIAGVGATVGGNPTDPGSGYSLRVGGGWSALGATQVFSANPVSRIGMAEVTPGGSSDMAVSVSYRRSIADGLSVTGAAEVHRNTAGSVMDPVSSASQLVVGAGLALHF